MANLLTRPSLTTWPPVDYLYFLLTSVIFAAYNAHTHQEYFDSCLEINVFLRMTSREGHVDKHLLTGAKWPPRLTLPPSRNRRPPSPAISIADHFQPGPLSRLSGVVNGLRFSSVGPRVIELINKAN